MWDERDELKKKSFSVQKELNRMASVWCLAFSVTRKEKIVYTLIKTQVRGEEALKERSYYL